MRLFFKKPLLAASLLLALSAQAEDTTHPNDGLWVTFDVAGERFRAVVTTPEAIDHVLSYVAGQVPQRVPNGQVVQGGELNKPWSWHLDPSSIEFADQTIELCDGRPSHVEENVGEWIGTISRYCPWDARIVQVKDCRSSEGSSHCPAVKGLYAGRSPAF